ncbi:PE/PPE C-terminal domain-containing protein [Mycobacterium sp.]|uniref:PE/PPE C-terminal domain-containing protein n=1 Tax=Mycobacterium sp. TaxID=1785 RepID=UPI003C78872A
MHAAPRRSGLRLFIGVAATVAVVAAVGHCGPDLFGRPVTSTSSTSGLTGILQGLGLSSPLSYADGAVSSAGLTVSSGAWGSASNADAAMIAADDQMTGMDGQVMGTLGQITGMEGRIMNRFDQLGAVRTAVSAGVGQATSVGALSVPRAWTTAAPAIRLAAAALPATSLSSAPEVFAGNPGSLFSGTALASMAGRAIGAAVRPGSGERVGVTTRARPALQQSLPGTPVAESPPSYANSPNSAIREFSPTRNSANRNDAFSVAKLQASIAVWGR